MTRIVSFRILGSQLHKRAKLKHFLRYKIDLKYKMYGEKC